MQRQQRKRGRIVMAFVLLASAFTVGVAAVGAPPVAAQDDGLQLSADATYRVLVDEGVIEVEIHYSATNLIPDRTQGLQIIQTFFSAIFEAIPKDATDIVARGPDGAELAVTRPTLTAEEQALVADSPFDTWEIDLGPNLFYQQTRDLTLTFRIPDGGSRNLDAWARVNPAFSSFPVVARGDGGRATVRVEFPPGFEVETFGEDVERSEAFGATILSQDDIADPGEWFVIVVASSDFGLARRSIEVEGIEGGVSVASWPGDVEWDEFVEEGVRDGVPLLEEAIGVPWPVEGELEIREAIAPALAGYGGWYYEPPETDEDDATIEVGEDLIPDLLIHEIAHAWFNDDFSRDRWINEGFAEYFGLRIAEEIAPGDVEPFEPVTANGPGSDDLVHWAFPDPFADPEEAEQEERWGYAASFQVMDAIATEIGPENFTVALVTLFDRANPYDTSLDTPGSASVEWRDLLDVFEHVGGSDTAAEIFTTWVLDSRRADELGPRADALDALVALAQVEPGWEHPDLVYELLADWEFDDAIALFDDLTDLQSDAQSVLDLARARGLDVPTEPRRAYEAITESREAEDALAGIRDTIAEQRRALERVLAAQDRADEPVGTIESLGLLGEDVDALAADAAAAFEAGDYDGAIAAADEVVDTLDDAGSVGTTRAVLIAAAVIGVIVLLGAIVLMIRRRRRRKRAGGLTESTEPTEPTEPTEALFESFPEHDDT